jgi:dUTP pyrophosphatase
MIIPKMHLLKIMISDKCPNRDMVEKYYRDLENRPPEEIEDSGIDLIFPEDVEFRVGCVTICNLGISCEFICNSTESCGFRLEPRSSISNTPLMLANSCGIIDKGYRGEIKAAFRCFIDRNIPDTLNESMMFKSAKGSRLVQIIAPDLKPIQVQVVSRLSETKRGQNGFGSTNFK